MHDRAAPPQRHGARSRLRRRYPEHGRLPRPPDHGRGTFGSTTSPRSATMRTATACSRCGGTKASPPTWSRACRAPAGAVHDPHRCARRAQLHLLALGLGRAATCCGTRAPSRSPRRSRATISSTCRASRSRSSIRPSARRWSRSPIGCARMAGGSRSTATIVRSAGRTPRRRARRSRRCSSGSTSPCRRSTTSRRCSG